jgi:hypothetical protein
MARNTRRLLTLIFAALITLLLVAACFPFRSRTTPTPDVNAIYTAAAVTMQGELTLEAGQTAVAQLTSLAAQTTEKAAPPQKATALLPEPVITITSTAAPPSEPPATIAPQLPSATPAAPCDQAAFLGDVTIPPDTLVQAGSVFSKGWRVQNTGACSWTSSYALVYTGGNLPSAAAVTYLPGSVPPGQIVELSVTITAPAAEGVYQGTWMLRNASGGVFGVGPNAADPLVARIRTYLPSFNTNFVYDLTAYYCSGSWRSGAGQLACPGQSQDPNGSVVMLNSPTLENRRSSDYGLWTRPNQVNNGWISGVMPAYTVQSGDYFLAEIGCLQNSPNCDVVFELDYQIVNGATGQLGRWREIYDGVTTLIDIDLSNFAGRSINLILAVYNNGLASQANAVWLLPRVQQSYQESSAALTWTRQGYYARSSCDELRVFYTTSNSAVAQAYDCRQGSLSLGQITLTTDQLNQLSNWVRRLEQSEGEIYAATQDRPVTSHVSLRGLGQGIVSNEELRTIESFAADLYASIVR